MHHNMQQNNTNQISSTDVSTLQLIRKLHHFTHIISMRSDGAAITLSRSSSGTDTLADIRPHKVSAGF